MLRLIAFLGAFTLAGCSTVHVVSPAPGESPAPTESAASSPSPSSCLIVPAPSTSWISSPDVGLSPIGRCRFTDEQLVDAMASLNAADRVWMGEIPAVTVEWEVNEADN